MNTDKLDSKNAVRVLYKALLGRDADPAGLAHYVSILESGRKTLPEVALEFVTAFNSREGKSAHPYESWNKEAIAFIHLAKTGGSTLFSLLSRCFPASRIFPERRNILHLYSPTYLANYDIFSGHLDYFSTRFIPRRIVRLISIFRDPFQRLISWYRDCRSHPTIGHFPYNINFALAKELSAEDFFVHPAIVSRPDANNAYLIYLGGSADHLLRSSVVPLVQASIDHNPDSDLAEALVQKMLENAVQNVRNLHGIGLTERFDDSVGLIFTTLGLPIPKSIEPVNVTDERPNTNERFKHVSQVEMTPRLSHALERLTRYDRVIYDVARQEFERRVEEWAHQSRDTAVGNTAVQS